jgi:hypothetical protein
MSRIGLLILLAASAAAMGFDHAMLASAGVEPSSSVPRSSATSAANVYIPCVSNDRSHYVFKVRPHRCGLYPPPGAGFYRATEERKIHWYAWGGYSARARGLECSFRRPCPNVPARMRAFRPVEACGRLVYSRWTVKTRYKKDTRHLPLCGGDTP